MTWLFLVFLSGAELRAVSPAGTVPANLLRLYLHFREPVTHAVPSSCFGISRLPGGNAVERPFLDFGEDGLWDRERKTLTLLFDPGRIKRGLQLNQTLGPPLQAGGRYRLQSECEGIAPFRHEFDVAGEERRPLDPAKWRILDPVPRTGTREPLRLEAPVLMDEPLFERYVRPDLKGSVSIDGGRIWSFVPDQPWGEFGSEYKIYFGARLEDVSGNRPGRSFDEPATGVRKEAQTVIREFRPRR
jgi:hypothetical protein